MPTGTEETETGEKFEDNALPWDSIDAATFVKSGDMKQFGPELLKNHNNCIGKDPEFQYIMKDIARFNALKAKRNIVSLNYAQREKRTMKMTRHVWRVSTNRFKREGKPLLKKLDNLPKDYQEPNPYLDETVHIALNLAKLEKRNLLCNLLRQNNPPTGTRNCACFFCSSSFRQADFQLCKVVSFW